jgi:hypothetical protein
VSSKSARACVVWATAHSCSKLGIGVQVLAFQPGCHAPVVNTTTSCVAGVIGVIGVMQELSIVVVIVDVFVCWVFACRCIPT